MGKVKELLDQLRLQKVMINLTAEDCLQLHMDEDIELSQDILNSIKNLKLDIIEYLKINTQNKVFEIPLAPKSPCYPLSYSQRRLWLLSQIDDMSVAYNIAMQFDLDIEYDIHALQKSVKGLVNKYEILRTVFRFDKNNDLKQWILPLEDFDFNIDIHDFSKNPNGRDKVQKLLQEKSRIRFDLKNGPLFRTYLIQVNQTKNVFICILHHIISDGWSRKVIFQEVQNLYEHFLKYDEYPALSKKPEYKDFALWQQNQIESGRLNYQRDFWMKKLSGELPLFNLPTERVRPPIASNNGEILSTFINAPTSRRLKKYSERNGGSFFMGLMTIWRVLMYRYTTYTDIIIGTPVAGRNHHDLENQIGCFVNTLALRQTIDPKDSFDEIFEQTKNNMLNAYAHQDYPFDKLLDELKIPREISRNPLFDLMLTMQNNEEVITTNLKDFEADLTIKNEGWSGAKLDLDVNFQEVGHYLAFNIIYNTDVYSRNLISNLMIHFESLISEILTRPHYPVGAIEFLLEKEKQEIIYNLNEKRLSGDFKVSLVSVFQGFVKSNPNKTALITEDKKFSYKELDVLSDQLAFFMIRNHQVSKNDFIGVMLMRNEWLLVSILSIFKIGAVYVPIDIKYPENRITHILDNLNCSLLINQELIDNVLNENFPEAIDLPNLLFDINDLAYIIHTSGSTGEPKSVMISHQGMMNHLKIMESELNLNSNCIIVQNASISFDISIWQLINALIVGGTTSIYRSDTILAPSIFLNRLKSEKANVLQVVPSYLNLLLNVEKEQGTKYLESLNFLLVTGEIAPKKLIEFWFNNYSNIPVVNAYGPAEAADDVTLHTMNNVPETSKIPIGNPVSNMAIYIVDDNENLCPKEVLGEIWVAGVGVGKGYLNDVEKTNEKFIANPFDKSLPRLYKTGDIGYWAEDNLLYFVGRKDHQVKVRGHRIELGEIENALREIEEISEVVVLVKKRGDEDVLVSYYTCSVEIDSEYIRNCLRIKIPDYMIPTISICLDELPTTTNGKIDVKCLVERDLNLERGRKSFEVPTTEIERKLSEIWKDILGREEISINDDFFEIGGDSLSLIKMAMKIQQQLSVEVTLPILFKFPSIFSLAKYLNYINYKDSENKEKFEILNI